MPDIRLDKAAKIYTGRSRQSAAALDVDLTIGQGDFVFLVGGPGSGKSTLIELISGELEPDRGRVYLDGVDLKKAGPIRGALLRGCMGVVSQDSELDRSVSVYKNLSRLRAYYFFCGRPITDARIRKALALVGMAGREEQSPKELTAAECRRVELARSIVHSPQILLLDGITDRMDDDAIWDMMHLLSELNACGTTVVMATDAVRYVNIMRRRVITLADGKIISDVRKGTYGNIM